VTNSTQQVNNSSTQRRKKTVWPHKEERKSYGFHIDIHEKEHMYG